MIREGYNPDRTAGQDEDQAHNLDTPFAVGEDEDEGVDELGHEQPWEHRRYGQTDTRSHDYGSLEAERNAWKE